MNATSHSTAVSEGEQRLASYLAQQNSFILRAIDAVPLHYGMTCLLYGLAAFGVLLACLLWAEADLSEALYSRSLILIPFLTGYVSMLNAVVARATNVLARELTPTLRQRTDTDPTVVSPYALSTRSFWLWIFVFQAVPAVAQLFAIQHDSAADWVIFWARQVLFLHYTTYVFLYAHIRATSQFVNREVEVTLHQRDELLPIGRLGVHLASTLAFALTVVGVLQIVLSADLGVLFMTAVMSAPAYALVLLAIFMPTYPARTKLLHAKRRELKRASLAMRNNESIDLFGTQIAGLDLLDYKSRVANISVWPMDLTTLRTIAVFFILPVLSWIAAAFVEVAVERAMGG